MATKLDNPVNRETASLRFLDRPVEVMISPATPCDVARALPPQPERIVFHVKGTQRYFTLPMSEAFLMARSGRGRDEVLDSLRVLTSAVEGLDIRSAAPGKDAPKWREWIHAHLQLPVQQARGILDKFSKRTA